MTVGKKEKRKKDILVISPVTVATTPTPLVKLALLNLGHKEVCI